MHTESKQAIDGILDFGPKRKLQPRRRRYRAKKASVVLQEPRPIEIRDGIKVYAAGEANGYTNPEGMMADLERLFATYGGCGSNSPMRFAGKK